LDWHVGAGLLIFSIAIVLRRTIGLHDFFLGFGEGLAIAFIIFGFIATIGGFGCSMLKSKRCHSTDEA
jgi:hypothetical protein